jgi:hypothetical protein
MPNTLTNVVQTAILENNKPTINSFLKQSYEQVKKQFGTGVSYMQEEVYFFKEDFSSFYYESGQCLNRMLLPVNNFLKDSLQIEKEFLEEISKESPHYMLMNGKMVPVENVLLMSMEENP